MFRSHCIGGLKPQTCIETTDRTFLDAAPAEESTHAFPEHVKDAGLLTGDVALHCLHQARHVERSHHSQRHTAHTHSIFTSCVGYAHS